MINRRRFALTAGLGCAVLSILMLVVIPAAFLFPFNKRSSNLPNIPSPLSLIPSLTENQAKAQDLETTRQSITGLERETYSELYTRLKPAVVAIRVYRPGGALQPREIASGIVLDGSGHILTSYQIDAGAAYLTVVYSGGLEKAATQAGLDEETGLSILKVESQATDAYPLAIAPVEDARLGEQVIAIAGETDKGGAIRTGLVSGSGTASDLGIPGSSLPELIRLELALPDEFSGAPVFNQNGQFIGLLRASTRQGAAETGGVRDVIPARFVHQVAPTLVEKGFYSWAWLGVEGTSLYLPLQEANQITEIRGVYLDQIIPGGPAAEAGLRGTTGTIDIRGLDVPTGGDTILAINGAPIADYSELLQALALRKPGDKVTLTVLHNGEIKDVQVVLAEKPR